MQSPLEVTTEEQYWLPSRDVSDSSTVALVYTDEFGVSKKIGVAAAVARTLL
jgi:hypothetical protein